MRHTFSLKSFRSEFNFAGCVWKWWQLIGVIMVVIYSNWIAWYLSTHLEVLV